MLTEFEGEYRSLRYATDDGSFMIASLACGTSIIGNANPNNFIRGMEYRFAGKWEEHASYGKQFRFTTCIAKEPVTDGAVMAYFSRYLFGCGAGIGESKGRQLIRQFTAKNVLSVIKTDPNAVVDAIGISLDNAKLAAEKLIAAEKFETTRMQLVMLFEGRGFSQTCIDAAIKDFGVCAAERIRRDPFTMLVRRYPSAGFMRCDQLYRDLGLSENRLKRQTICLWNYLNKAGGSVWVDCQQAIIELNRLISSATNPKKAIILGRRAKWLSTRRDNGGRLWLAEFQEAVNERKIHQLIETIRDAKELAQSETDQLVMQ